jgi:hypothetical protein
MFKAKYITLRKQVKIFFTISLFGLLLSAAIITASLTATPFFKV